MGLLDKINEKKIKRHTRQTCRLMVYAFLRAKNNYSDKNYGDWVSYAISTRPKWEQIDLYRFQYKKRDGAEIEIKKKTTLRDAIEEMLEHEFEDYIRISGSNPHRVIRIIIGEIEDFFQRRIYKDQKIRSAYFRKNKQTHEKNN